MYTCVYMYKEVEKFYPFIPKFHFYLYVPREKFRDTFLDFRDVRDKLSILGIKIIPILDYFTIILYNVFRICLKGVFYMTRSDIAQSDREKEFEQKLVNKRGSTINNKNSKAYMSNPDVKEFNRELRKKMFTKIGGPYKWNSIEELEEETGKFLELCDRTNTIPTIVNLSVWLGCHKDTIYAHANDPNSPFSDFFKNLINFFHGSIESSAIGGGVNPVLYMFLGKNYYGMRDDKNITVSATNDSGGVNAQETADALQKQLEEEHITEATISEK